MAFLQKKIFLMLLAFHKARLILVTKFFRLTHLYILQTGTVFEIHNCKIFEMCIFLLNATVYCLLYICKCMFYREPIYVQCD